MQWRIEHEHDHHRHDLGDDERYDHGVSYQLPIVTANAATGGYDAELTVGIAA